MPGLAVQAVKSIHLIKRRHGQANWCTFPPPPPKPPTTQKCFRRCDLCAQTNGDMDIHLKHGCPWQNPPPLPPPQSHMVWDDPECPVADADFAGLNTALSSPMADTERPRQAAPVCANPQEVAKWCIVSSEHDIRFHFAPYEGL